MGRLNLVVAVLLMLSAISLVTSRYQARQTFVELEQARTSARGHEVDWRQLQLERSELSRNARIDRIARERLQMVSIVPDRTAYINQAPSVPTVPQEGDRK